MLMPSLQIGGVEAGVHFGKRVASGPTNLTLPRIDTPIPTIGETIIFTSGSWTGSPSFTYQVFLDGVLSFDCASDPFYVVQAGDAGHSLSVQVTATSGGSTTAMSAATDAVGSTICVLKTLGEYTGTTGVGSQVSNYPDLSATGSNPSQGTMSAQPLVVSIQNGRLGVSYDGVSNYLGTSLVVTGPFTVFSVMESNSSGGSTVCDSGTPNIRPIVYQTGSSNNVGIYNGTAITGGTWNINTMAVLSATIDPVLGVGNAWVNGVSAISNGGIGVLGTALNPLLIGTFNPPAQFFSLIQGYLGVFTGIMNTTHRQWIEAFLKDYYGF